MKAGCVDKKGEHAGEPGRQGHCGGQTSLTPKGTFPQQPGSLLGWWWILFVIYSFLLERAPTA